MLHYPIHLHAGPGPLLAFVPDPDPTTLAETAVALANTDGGVILLGLSPDGTYTGAGDDLDAALQQADAHCKPSLTLDHRETIFHDHGPLMAVQVARGVRVHALDDGRVLVREGAANRVLDGTEIRRLVSARTTGDFEADAVPGTRPGHLSPDLLAEFMLRRADRSGLPVVSYDQMLLDIGAVTLPDYQATVAGMLLFGAEPQRWLPQSGIRFVRYVGKKTQSGVVYDRMLHGPLMRLLDETWDLVREQGRQTDSGDEDYPADAVREALVNAACHRDYRLRKQPIEVRIFADRLEVISPGGLPGFLTEKHLVGGRFSRNPCLAWSLFQWGYTQEPGLGLRRMIEVMAQRGHRPPQFEARPYRVTVRLYKARTDGVPPGSDGALSDPQRRALDYARLHGSVTLRELGALCPNVRPDRLQTDLADLAERGRLRKVGARAGAYYILP